MTISLASGEKRTVLLQAPPSCLGIAGNQEGAEIAFDEPDTAGSVLLQVSLSLQNHHLHVSHEQHLQASTPPVTTGDPFTIFHQKPSRL